MLDVTCDAALRALGVAAFTSGLGPLLGRWLEDGRLRAPPDGASLLARHLRHSRDRADRTASILSVVSSALSDANATGTVLKGGHTAWSYFPEPGTRPAADVDIAVRRTEMHPAEEALEAAGFACMERQPRLQRSVWRPLGEGEGIRSLELTHREAPITVDLHGSLERDFFGIRTVDLGDPVDGSERWSGGPAHLGVLRQPRLTAYLAAHASEGVHSLSLLRLVELVLVIRSDVADGRLEWRELEAFLRARDARRFVYPALALVERLVPGTVDSAFLDSLEADAPPPMIRVLDRLRPSDAQRTERVRLEERFMWARGPREWIRRTVHMLWPSWVTGWSKLARVYAERFFRVLRGRVDVSRRPE